MFLNNRWNSWNIVHSPITKINYFDDIPIISNSYATAILGAIIFYLITFWAVDYVVEFIKWAEDSLVKIPITDIIFGSVGLIFGLLVLS